MLILISLLALAMIPMVSAAGSVHVARGDSLVFTANVPVGSAYATVWMFGYHNDIYVAPVTVNGGLASVVVPAGIIETMDNSEYTMYLQTYGNNGLQDVSYDGKSIKTIYKSIPDADVTVFDSTLKKQKFESMKDVAPIDDTFALIYIVVEDPVVTVANMYTNADGDLHIDAKTNLNPGNPIYAIIDEEIYSNTQYRDLMSNRSIVTDNVTERRFWLEFKQAASTQLTSGTHTIDIHFLKNGVTAIPFKRHIELSTPVPTPIMRTVYDFTGDELGYYVNTTRPTSQNVSALVTAKPTPSTFLAAIHINNRTISQRGDIYVGEKNLDVWGALGWQDASTSNYDFKIMYCDGDGTVVTVNNPRHFNVDYETFGNRLGAWCQYQSEIDEPDPPIAFMVRSPSGINMTDPYYVPTTSPTTTTAAITPVVTGPGSYAVVDGEAPPPQTPAPIPTTEAIVVPLPWGIALLAVAFIAAWKR